MSISELYRNLNPTLPSTNGVGGSAPVLKAPKDGKGVEKGLKPEGPSEFQKILSNENKGIHLSQHAETRIRSRDIPWDAHMEKRISSGIDQAESKGSREALILADNVAVIANVKSRTVVTAMDRNQMKDRVFTNIDSAVLV